MTETEPPAETDEPEAVATWSELPDREPAGARVAGVDLVVVRYNDGVSVLYGRCQHRGVLLSDGHADGENLICGVHGWDYRCACGHDSLSGFEQRDLTTWKSEITELTGSSTLASVEQSPVDGSHSQPRKQSYSVVYTQ